MRIIKFKDLKYTPASHEDLQKPGVWKKVLLRKNDLVQGEIQMINWAKLPKGKSFSPHYHEDMEEVFIMLEGRVKIMVGEETATLIKGDAIVIPAQQIHLMKNIGKSVVYYIALGISQGKNGKTVNVSTKNPF